MIPVVLLVGLVVPSCRRLGALIAGVIGWAAGTGFGSLVQYEALGRWLPLHVTYHVDSSFRSDPFLASRLESIRQFLAPDWMCGVAVAVWLLALAMVLSPGGARSRFALPLAVGAVGCSLVAAFVVPGLAWLAGSRPTEAFPVSAPAAVWLVLSAFPLALWGHDRAPVLDRHRLLLVIAAVWLPVAVTIARPIRSFEWGGRVFVPTVVVLTAVMGSIPIAGSALRSARRTMVALVIAVAIVIQGLGLALAHHGVATHRGLADEVAAFVDANEPVVSDAYMVPLLAGRHWFEARYLYCTRQRDLPRLLASIGAASVDRWTYATVLRAPGQRLEIAERIVDRSGNEWLMVDHLERPIRSQTVRLLRFRRVKSASRDS
jgi:hypothetical protein